MNKIFYIIIVFCIFLTGCSSDYWHGYFYPDAPNLIKYTTSPTFNSLNECRAWAENELTRRDGRGDYECGKNCKYDFSSDLNTCLETKR